MSNWSACRASEAEPDWSDEVQMVLSEPSVQGGQPSSRSMIAPAGVDEVAFPPVVDRRLGHRCDLRETAAALDQIDDAASSLGDLCTLHVESSFIPEAELTLMD